MSVQEQQQYIEKLLKYYRDPDPETRARMAHGPALYRQGMLSFSLANADGSPYEGTAEISFRQTGSEYEFGCNGFMLDGFSTETENALYADRFKELFNLMVIPFYWGDLEPERGKPRYDRNSPKIYRRPPPDLLLDFCEKNAITPKGHLLLYDHHGAPWLKRDTTEHLKQIYERHVREIAERYGDRIFNWDVTNEVTYNTPTGTIPEDFAHFAFDLAEKYFPRSTRFNYNDGHLWRDHHGYYSMNNLLENWLLSSGRRIDAIGVQCHMIGGGGVTKEEMLSWWGEYYFNPEYMNDVLDIYAKVGRPLTLSEITLTASEELGPGAQEFQRETADFLYRLWFAHPATNGIIWWNLVDGTALGAENLAKGGLLNRDLSPKPAWHALKKLILNEWRSNGEIHFDSASKNYLRGFFGTYELVIRTPDGRVHTAVEKIVRGRKNTAKIVLN